jgi:uncharacterized LabA/DUF88 family protein
VQNLYYSAKILYKSHVNFRAILKDVVNSRTLIRAKAYVIKSEDTLQESFFGALENIGFEVRIKDLQVFPGGAKKGDWDVGLAMDAVQQAPKLDTIIIVSGDGDYIPLIEHLRVSFGCRVEVAAFAKSTSSKLIQHADSFFDLGKSQKYIIKESPKKRAKRSKRSR